MGKTIKKFLCSLLVVVICLTSAPLEGFIGNHWFKLNISSWFSGKANAATIAQTGQCGDGVYWEYYDSSRKLIISGNGDMWDYDDSVRSPFYNSYIKHLQINEGVTTIGSNAFELSTLSTVTLPDSLLSIGNNAFVNCEVSNFTIPKNVTFIGADAFNGCKKLSAINVPDGVTEIEGSVFSNCEKLRTITIGAGLSELSLPAFNDCPSLVSIVVDENNQYFYSDENGVLFNKDKTMLIKYPENAPSGSYVIPEGITIIAESAFRNSINLKSITLPNSLMTIESHAFQGCSSLAELDIPKNVTTIKDFAFYGCVEISGTLKIPDSVTQIGNSAFMHCRKIDNLIIGNGVKIIEAYTFSYCYNVNSLIIGNSVKTIGVQSFCGLRALETLTVPSNVTSIGNKCFFDCGINSLTLSEGLIEIGEYAFVDAINLKSVHIPATVENIGFRAFCGSNDTLEEITVAEDNRYYSSDKYGVLFNKSKTVLIRYPRARKDATYIIPDTVKTIEREAFYYARALVVIIMDDSATSLGENAFYNCTSLERIILSKKLKKIPENSFYGCGSLKNIVLNDGITEIGESAFGCCDSLENITIPKSLTSIKRGAFSFSKEENASKVKVYYKGTEKEWQKINIEHNDSDALHHCKCPLVQGTIYYDHKGYSVGDVVKFGSYPQNEETDYTIIAELNRLAPKWEDWISYGYYSGDGSYGSMVQGDWMRYVDITYGGNKYRGVMFTQYRPTYTYETTSQNNSSYNYYVDTVYWFKYEPLYWRVLDPTTGFVMSELIIDCQPFNNCVYEIYGFNYTVFENDWRYFKDEGRSIFANDYVNSDIRNWLNDDFYNTAFTEKQQIEILKTTVNNNGNYKEYYSTLDKVFLLHRHDIENKDYGFEMVSWGYDEARLGKATDYSKIQGVGCDDKQFSASILRTASSYSGKVFRMDGRVHNGDTQFTKETCECSGIRPGMILGFVSNASVKTKYNQYNKSSEQKITITPKDASGSWLDDTSSLLSFATNVFESMSGVKINSSLGESTVNTSFTAKKTELQSSDIVLSRDNYCNYIIPKAVIASWYTPTGTSYKFDAFMKKDKKNGKPYVSTVFGRESGDDLYKELTIDSISFFEDKKYDIIVSAEGLNGKSATYYISQDKNCKIPSKTGVFSSEDLFSKLDYSKTVYAYFVTSDGVTSDLVAINLMKSLPQDDYTKRLLSGSEISIVGSGGQKIKIGKDFPLIGGSEISLEALKIPNLGIDIKGDTVRISVGLNIFSSEKTNASERENTWVDFKKGISTLGDNFKSSKEALKHYRNFVKYFSNEKGLTGKQSYYDSGTAFNISTLGYLEGTLINGKIVFKEALVKVKGSFTFSYTQQGAIWIIPAYFYVNAGAEVSLITNRVRQIADDDIPLDFGFALDINPSLKIGGGAGVKKGASLGLWGKGSLPYYNNFTEKYHKFSIKGEFGWEAELFILKANGTFLEGEIKIIDNYYGKATRLIRSFKDDYVNTPQKQSQTNVSVASRDYVEDTSEWLGEHPISVYSLADNGISVNVLQTSVFDQNNPQLVSFGDRVMMVWVQDDASRDTYNRMRLVYSLYDAENDSWSEPKAVYDDGHNDAYPSIATDGENVYVAWQKINKTVTESDATNVDVFFENSEIFVAEYDIANDCFINVSKLTDNEVYDYIPSVIVNNGEAVVYYATNNNNNLVGVDNNTLYRHKLGEPAEVLADKQSYIISATPEIVNNTEKLSYSVDTDGDVSTSNDITVYTISNGTCTTFNKNANDVAYTFADYSMLNGIETLFVSDMNNIYYEQAGETKSVFNEPRFIEGNINFIDRETGLSILWTEKNEVGGNEFWTTSYEDGEWTEPIQISNIGSFKVSNVDVAMLGGKLVGICNMNEMSLDEESDTYLEGVANLCSFTANDFTDISVDIYTVDEAKIIPGEICGIDVYVNNVGTTDVNRIEFSVSDTLGTDATVIKDVNIKSGVTELITVDYPVPENYAATTLTITASIPYAEESDTIDNTESIEIGKSDLSIMQMEIVNFGNNYTLKAVVENNSAVAANDVIISAIFNNLENEVFEQSKIVTLDKGEYIDYEIAFNKDLVEFDENGVGKLYIKTTSSSIESADGDNIICVAVTLPNVTECAHPLIEVIEGREPTCIEPGESDYEICLACEKIVTEPETITSNHILSDWYISIPATCINAGTQQRHCTVCNLYSETKEVASLGHDYKEIITPATCTSNGYTTYICNVCNEGYTSNITEKISHSLDNWYTVIPAKCEMPGIDRRDCLECTYTETQEIAATGHEFEGSACKNCDYDKADSCDCKCHKSGIAKIIFKIILIFQKIFKKNKECTCGVYHY